jgi:hypothetical protein
MILTRKDRQSVRSITREHYLTRCATADVPSASGEHIKEYTLKKVKQELKQSRRYQSVIGTLLLGLALRLAEKLIMKWIEEKLFSSEQIATTYQETEPGYESRDRK